MIFGIKIQKEGAKAPLYTAETLIFCERTMGIPRVVVGWFVGGDVPYAPFVAHAFTDSPQIL
ncbi:hypothetical protein [Gemmiger sp.]|jgi:hypothetical protein|uniref:hypothetical protein n=1 Tax=Gemmiger sp. TaxID=2049027 RepID=UPI002A908A3E|nr:hypothetical protein [Gemmiger sp.]